MVVGVMPAHEVGHCKAGFTPYPSLAEVLLSCSGGVAEEGKLAAAAGRNSHQQAAAVAPVNARADSVSCKVIHTLIFLATENSSKMCPASLASPPRDLLSASPSFPAPRHRDQSGTQ